jgi:hypothetical protein
MCSYMHLFKKWSKNAFAYASMQMHNYPKPSRKLTFNDIQVYPDRFVLKYELKSNYIIIIILFRYHSPTPTYKHSCITPFFRSRKPLTGNEAN